MAFGLQGVVLWDVGVSFVLTQGCGGWSSGFAWALTKMKPPQTQNLKNSNIGPQNLNPKNPEALTKPQSPITMRAAPQIPESLHLNPKENPKS